MKIDRYTKVVLTIIAVGVIGLNVHFYKDDFVKEAHAEVESHDHSPYEWWAKDMVKRVGGNIFSEQSHRHRKNDISSFESAVEDIIEDCRSRGEGARIMC